MKGVFPPIGRTPKFWIWGPPQGKGLFSFFFGPQFFVREVSPFPGGFLKKNAPLRPPPPQIFGPPQPTPLEII